MKKYITIAALLAAGSAFANAALTEIADFSTLMNEATTVGTVTNVSSAWQGSTVYDFEDNGAAVGLTNSSVINALTAESGVVVVAAWIKLDTDASQYNTLFGWGESGTGFKFGVKDDDLFMVTKNVAETVKGFSIAKDEWTLIDLQYNVANKQFRLQATTTDGQYYTVSDNTTMNAVSIQQFAIGSANGDATSDGENFDGLIGNLKIFTSTGFENNQTVFEALGAAPIPEPSAFGLLAGLGALALVGTRRRRR